MDFKYFLATLMFPQSNWLLAKRLGALYVAEMAFSGLRIIITLNKFNETSINN